MQILPPSLFLGSQNPEKYLLKKDNCPVTIQVKSYLKALCPGSSEVVLLTSLRTFKEKRVEREPFSVI